MHLNYFIFIFIYLLFFLETFIPEYLHLFCPTLSCLTPSVSLSQIPDLFSIYIHTYMHVYVHIYMLMNHLSVACMCMCLGLAAWIGKIVRT